MRIVSKGKWTKVLNNNLQIINFNVKMQGTKIHKLMIQTRSKTRNTKTKECKGKNEIPPSY